MYFENFNYEPKILNGSKISTHLEFRSVYNYKLLNSVFRPLDKFLLLSRCSVLIKILISFYLLSIYLFNLLMKI